MVGLSCFGTLAAFHPLFAADAAPPDYRFHVMVLAEGIPQPMELEIAPDGRVFFNEITGKLQIFHPGSGQITTAGEMEVFTGQENGLLGFALDPAFSQNQWIYVFYSPVDFTGERLSRFKMNGDTLDLSSETRILQFGSQRRECCHHAGSVEFGPDGHLFISTGDNTHPGGDSSGYAPIDERPDRSPWDAQKSSANTHDLRGKILRIKPLPDGSYEIPDGNLFPKDGSEGRPEIYVMGCRNPWRVSVDERTGIIYWGEVGPDAGGDGPRGPRGYDEINQARKAGNFGWPYFVGNNFAYADFDFEKKEVGAKYDPERPINESPNNTGSRDLPPAQPAFLYWPYAESPEFPMLGSGGRTACAGPVFHFQPEFRETGGFPEYFDNCLLFYDWQRPFMKWARLDKDSDLKGIEPFTEAVVLSNDRDRVNALRATGKFVIQRPVDSQFGPDGCLYLLDYGQTWGANPDARLLKISYQWGNLAPVAKATGEPTNGEEPLEVRFSGQGTVDHEGDPLRYEWKLHPGGRVFSRETNATYVFKEPGNYVAELLVQDNKGGRSVATVPIVAGNSAPTVRFLKPQDGDFFSAGQSLAYEILVEDEQDGSSRDYGELFEGRTYLNVEWREGERSEKTDPPGLSMMKQSDCFNCHAVHSTIVGPPFIEIAARYRDEPDALEASVERVIHGSTGVWGDVPMLPHASLNPDQVRMMVRWIYALKPGEVSGAWVRGLSGTLIAPKDEKLRTARLEASYTDRGRGPTTSLTGHSTVTLRSRQLEGEAGNEKKGLKVLGNYLGAIEHDSHVMFERINTKGVGRVTIRVASAGAGGCIELRAGSSGGPLLGQVQVDPTGGWENWTLKEIPLEENEFPGDLFVVFKNPGKGGLMNLDWLRFHPH